MIELSRYVLETLRKDEEFILYRGRSQGDASGVLVLSPVLQYPRSQSLKRLEHEYSFSELLHPRWAARPIAIASHRDRTVLVLEDPGGVPMDQLPGRPLDVALSLRLAISLSTAIDQLHERGVIHKDIKPANVLANSVTGQCWLMGFGIASQLPRERLSPEPPEYIAGSLAYMAPEQTGRMNRSIDSRSDLYSLGVTLYELLTGSLPFSAFDPMEWVHCHLARKPVPPDERFKNVPACVSAIIVKLLAKTAEERYQTAAGVQSDLRRCLAEWETRGRIDEFPLGEHDTPERLLIPEKLYGRASDIDTLLSSFDRVVAGGRPELVLVSGYSGIGKSSVVNELNKSLVPCRGLFASGKFDQYKRDIPYATLAQAFQSLLRPLLTKSEAELSKWRDSLREALGPSGQLMVNLVPELKLIIGEQPPVPELSSQDAQRRFQLVFRRFIDVFARPEHPVALFLDDLQWLDAATLDLIEDLLTQPDVQYLLLIGAYRDNEVNAHHPLMRKLEAVRQAGAFVQEITLAPLVQEDLKGLIADSLRCAPDRVVPLALLVHEKTGGNPFFAIQFISALAEEGLLTFDHGTAQWSWDLGRIHAKGYTDNVVDLMVGKLNRLPVETQKALKEFACLGNSAEAATLSIVHGTSEEEVHSDLWEAWRLGFILRLEGSYRFVHDRVQEAAYFLIPEELRAETHLRMGRQLYSSLALEEDAENIFKVVNQLNAGAALITERTEKERVAELNLAAGQKTKASAAYALARNYFALGMAMAGRISWKRRYDLALSLWLERAECEFVTGNIETAERLLSEALQKARSKLDKAAAYRLRVQICVMKTQNAQAVNIALECLGLFGIKIPPHPTPQQVQNEYEEVWKNLKGRSIARLIELPRMSDPEMQAAMSVLSALSAPAMNTDNNLFRLLICHMLNVSVRYGITAASTHGFAWFGVILGPVFHRYKDGYQFGKVAVDLVEKYEFLGWKAKVYYAMETVLLWTKPLNSAIDCVRTAFLTGIETGDLTFACYSSHHLVTDLLLRGEHLDQVWLESTKAYDFARNAKFRDVADAVLSIQRFVQNLRGGNRGSSAEADDERAFEARLRDSPMPTKFCWYWILRLWAHFMSGDYAAAIAAGEKARALLWASEGHIQLLDYRYYTALSAAAFWKEAPPDKQGELLDLLIQDLAQLKEWAENCPSTFQDKYALAAAEFARIEGRELDAERLYEEAIRSARANGFVYNEALAYELAGRFYSARGFEDFAPLYLRKARYCYLRWGADGKVRQLEELYPYLSEELPAPRPVSTIGAPVEHLDLATVIKASHAISSEIVLEKLINTLMRTALEQAGAERGLLILARGNEHRIEAEANSDRDKVTVHSRRSLVTPSELPESLFRYVVRTQESVTLRDASIENLFSEDEYIKRKRPRSVFCLPLVKQGKLVGVLYLENNLAPAVFTSNRVATLELIASQAAISWEQARLYAELTRTNEDLQTEISERKRAEEALKKSEQQLQDIVDNTTAMITVKDLQLYYLLVNREYERRFHTQRERIRGKTDYDFVPRDVAEQIRANDRQVIEGGKPIQFEVAIPTAENVRHYVMVKFLLRDGTGKPYAVCGISTDITERKRAEELQARRARQAALRADIHAAFLAGTEGALPSMLQRSAEAIARHLDAACARIWTLNERKNMLELQASAGLYTHLDGEHASIALGHLTIGRIAQERSPHLTNDIQNDEHTSEREWAKQEGMVAFAGYPLLVEGRLVGALAMFAREQLAQDTFESIEMAVDAVAQGIERKRAEETLARLNRTLKTVYECNQALVRATEEYELLRSVCRILVEVGGLPTAWVGYKVLDGEKTVRPVAQAGYEDGFLERIGVTWDDSERGRGPTGTAIRTGTVCASRDMLSDPRMAPWRGEVLKLGHASSIALPLMFRGEAFGALALYAEELDAFNEETVKHYTDLANNLAYGVIALRTGEERARSEEALRASERQLQDIIDNTTSIIFVKDLELRYLLVNREYERRFHVQRKEIRGKSDFDIHPRVAAEAVRANDRQVIEAGEPIEFEESVPIDGREHHYVVVKFLLRDRAEKPYAVCGIATDITELKRAEALEAEMAREREAFLEEKTRLAGEIHDSLAQSFTGIWMQLDLAKEVMTDKDSELFGYVERADDLARFGLAEARRSVMSLQSKPVNESNLIESLEILAERSNIAGRLRCTFRSNLEDDQSLPAVVRQDLLRIAQEAISNALRHAKSTTISVNLRSQPPNLILKVKDNGCGITSEAETREGFGFANMRTRVKRLKGTLDVRSVPGRGTTIAVRVPLG